MAYTLSGLHKLAPLGAVTGEAIAQGELVALHTDCKFYLAQAQVGANFQMGCVGIAAHDAAAGEDLSVVQDDPLVGGASGLTIGGAIYVGEDVAGTITQTLPATTGDADQQVGVARSATQFAFNVANFQYALHA